MGVLHIVQTSSDPTDAPTGIGHHWVNTSTRDTWISVGTANVSDWKKVNNDAASFAGIVSVNGKTGPVVSLITDDIPEGAVNKYFSSELVQDAVAASLVDSTSVDFTYNDGLNAITAAVLPAGVNHNALQNYSINRHIDHSAVNISTESNSGLSGGGDISVTRSLVVDIAGTTAVTSVENADEILIWDVSANARRKTTRANLLGTPIPASTDNLPEGSTNKYFTSERVDDRVASLLVEGAGIDIDYNDAANTLTISSSLTQYTDEAAQDAVGSSLTDSPSVDFTYNDAANTITAVVLPAGVNHDSLSNVILNKHIDHSTVLISTSAGTSGLSGGGSITTTRNIAVDINGTVSLGASPDPLDELLIWDSSALALKKVNYTQLTSGFDEQIRDVIGASLINTSTIALNHNDALDQITANINPESIDSSHVYLITPVKIGDELYSRHKATIITSNNSPATAFILDASSPGTLLVEARISAYRTGGTLGNPGDGASFIRTFRVKTVGSTTTMHDVQSDYTSRDDLSMNIDFSVNLTNIKCRVKGVNNNTLRWTMDIIVNRNN
jgi:hypothetical protein